MVPRGATGAQGRSGATARTAVTVCVVTAAERTMGFRAVARLLSCAPVALLGIMRSQAVCALRHSPLLSAPFRPARLRRCALRALRLQCPPLPDLNMKYTAPTMQRPAQT